jgi:hypothetical protein
VGNFSRLLELRPLPQLRPRTGLSARLSPVGLKPQLQLIFQNLRATLKAGKGTFVSVHFTTLRICICSLKENISKDCPTVQVPSVPTTVTRKGSENHMEPQWQGAEVAAEQKLNTRSVQQPNWKLPPFLLRASIMQQKEGSLTLKSSSSN